MKFLPLNMDSKNLMLINTYYDRGSYDMNKADDILDIVYKDMETGKKYVETIVHPKYEIWVVKPEFRTYKHIRDWIRKEQCTPHMISYKNRYSEAAKILGVTSDVVKYSPYIMQFDIDIEHFYRIQFDLNYGNDLTKKLSCGYLDIEADIINISVSRFAEPGEAPINCVSYLDSERMQMYTLVNVTDNLPIVPEDHPKYQYYEILRRKFKEQSQEFINDSANFATYVHDKYQELYGNINYNIMVFDNEALMLQTLFQILHLSDNDFIEIWNAPYDEANLIERPRALGLRPDDLIPSPDFGKGRHVYMKEDKNHLVHKRKHIFNTYTKYIVTDQMVNYAGIRSARGKLPSTKLNAIAKTELKDEKYDYSEIGNIRYFVYENFKKFIEYNIKDVLLQFGIDRKTNDISSIYNTMVSDCVCSSQVFTSTLVVGNSLRKYADKNGFVLGSNRNKLFKQNENTASEDDVDLLEVESDDDDDSSDETENESSDKGTDKKDEKYAGAMVMAPQHMSTSGYMLLGILSKYIHKHAIDFDIGAEYPSAMIIMNSCNETLVGKVNLLEPEKVKVLFYDNFYFVDSKDETGYEKTRDPSNLMMEWLSQNDPINFGHCVLSLPEPTDILSGIEDNMEEFIA